jgi:hypothetical protein
MLSRLHDGEPFGLCQALCNLCSLAVNGVHLQENLETMGFGYLTTRVFCLDHGGKTSYTTTS